MKKVSDKNELKRQMITQIEEQLKEIKDVDILLGHSEPPILLPLLPHRIPFQTLTGQASPAAYARG